MRKQLYVTDGKRMVAAVIRNYEKADFAGLLAVQAECFPPPFPPELWWNEHQLTEHIVRFPDGALCVEIGGVIVGSMTALRLNVDDNSSHDWEAATDGGYIRNHDPAGDTLYVVDIAVVPSWRKFGLGKWLMLCMYETVVHLGCRRLLGGGRMPGYGKLAAELTPQQYLEQVTAGKRTDPVVTFLLRCGRVPVGIAANYLEDEESAGYAALMEWRNPFHSELGTSRREEG